MVEKIIVFLDSYLTKAKLKFIDPVEANVLLEKEGLLNNNKDRPGLPLRNLLRKGKLPHAFQIGGKGSTWRIPHSNNRTYTISTFLNDKPKQQIRKSMPTEGGQNENVTVDTAKLKKQLEQARLKYKPDIIKYLLIAEAPPDSLERFFYYDKVRQHDYLFLGISEALYPELKEKFILSGRDSIIKHSILLKLKSDGFYLLDLSELPLSLLNSDLPSQLSNLLDKIRTVVNNRTKIILIKANVYDTAFHYLSNELENVINRRITFPGQGGQRKFQEEFKQALKKAEYF